VNSTESAHPSTQPDTCDTDAIDDSLTMTPSPVTWPWM
jgi:hypothetical protein